MKKHLRAYLVKSISMLIRIFPIPWEAYKVAMTIFNESYLKTKSKNLETPIWIQPRVKLIHPESIAIGACTTIEGNVALISSEKNLGIRLGKNVHIRSGSHLFVGDQPEGYIIIGDGTLVNYNCTFLGNGGINIGKNVLISPGVVITSFQHGFQDRNMLIVEQPGKFKTITIEDNVYLGSNVVVCPGVKIGQGSVIGAGAVVNKDISEYSVAVGVPARIIKRRL